MKRHEFLKIGAGMATGLALGQIGCKTASVVKGGSIADFGLQLYTLRDSFPDDPKGLLKQVASFGYKQVESFEGSQGMFWGLGNIGFKAYVEDLGMKVVSSHCDISKDFERKAADAGAIGMKYLICPWVGKQKTLDDYKKLADTFNKCGDICKTNGLRFAYHNHDYSFTLHDGQYPQDIMMQNTNPDTVDYEMDMYWVVTAKQDPEVWLKKYGSRFRLCHVKDRAKNATEAADTCTLGEGSIDYPKILKTASTTGMLYYIVEQEKYAGTTPIKAVEADAGYMKKLKF